MSLDTSDLNFSTPVLLHVTVTTNQPTCSDHDATGYFVAACQVTITILFSNKTEKELIICYSSVQPNLSIQQKKISNKYIHYVYCLINLVR